MSAVHARERILIAFAYEGVRAFFRPKLREEIQLPVQNSRWFPEDVRAEFARHSSAYRYIGMCVEILVGATVFAIGVSLAVVLQQLGDKVLGDVLQQYRWVGLVDGLATGLVFVDLVLFFVFSSKLLHAVLRRLRS